MVLSHEDIMLGVMIKLWNKDQKDQIYLSIFSDILAGVAEEYCIFVGKKFDHYPVEYTQHTENYKF